MKTGGHGVVSRQRVSASERERLAPEPEPRPSCAQPWQGFLDELLLEIPQDGVPATGEAPCGRGATSRDEVGPSWMPELEREAVTHPLQSVQRFAQESKACGTNSVIAPRPAAS